MQIIDQPTIAGIKAAIDRCANIADGTFMVVRQQWLLELTMYEYGRNDDPPAACGCVWVVTTGRIPLGDDTIYNSSHATDDWYDAFTAEHQTMYFDDAQTAHQYMADFVMAHQINGL